MDSERFPILENDVKKKKVENRNLSIIKENQSDAKTNQELKTENTQNQMSEPSIFKTINFPVKNQHSDKVSFKKKSNKN